MWARRPPRNTGALAVCAFARAANSAIVAGRNNPWEWPDDADWTVVGSRVTSAPLDLAMVAAAGAGPVPDTTSVRAARDTTRKAGLKGRGHPTRARAISLQAI